MKRLAIIAGMALMGATAIAESATEPRCGNDAFGNVVCLDQNGVLSTKPARPKGGKPVESGAAKAGTTEDEADNGEAGDEAGRHVMRCGIDPFGNKVCR